MGHFSCLDFPTSVYPQLDTEAKLSPQAGVTGAAVPGGAQLVFRGTGPVAMWERNLVD